MVLLLLCVILSLCIGFGSGHHGLATFVVVLTFVRYVVGAMFSEGPIKKPSVVSQERENFMNTLNQNMAS